MNTPSRAHFGIALSVALLLLGVFSFGSGTATAATDATLTHSHSLRTSWANRYVRPARTPAKGHLAPQGRVVKPMLTSQSLFDLSNPNLDVNDSINTSTSIAVDPLSAGSVTPKVINAQNVDVAVAITYTDSNFATTASDYTDLTGAIKSGTNTANADVVFQPSTLWTSAATCNVGFVATSAYTLSNTTYANGIALYKVAADGTITYTPTPVAGYYNTAATGSSIAITVYDQPSLAYNPNAGGSNGTLYAFFVGSTWTATVGSDPTTYTGSDIFRAQSTDCGATWTGLTAISNTNACTSQYSGHGNCDDVYYPSAIVTKGGVTWFAFLCQCASTTKTTGRGSYVLMSNRVSQPNTYGVRASYPVNNGDADFDQTNHKQTLPNALFYANSEGNLAYNPNVSAGASTNGTADGGLLLTYAHATTAGNVNSWKVVVRSIPVRTDASRGTVSTQNVGSLTIYPHIADRVNTTTGGNPVVGYYTWNSTTKKVVYSVTRFDLSNSGVLSNPISLSDGLAHDPQTYIGEVTGLDVNAVAPGGSPDTSWVYGSFTGPGPNSNDAGDNWIWVLKK